MDGVRKPVRSGSNASDPDELWLQNGVFYARLPGVSGTSPMTVALHGIATEEEALETYQTLIRLAATSADAAALAAFRPLRT